MTTQPEKHHVHHSYIWLGSIRIVFIILLSVSISMGSSLIGLVASDVATGSGDLFTTLVIFGVLGLVVLLVIGLVVAYQVVSYKHLWYELGAEEFNLYSGVFSKKRVHVPYRRIQSVDQNASLLQRIFGVCTVSIDTAGGSNNKAIQVPYLQKAQAEALRTELYRSAGLQPAELLDAAASPGCGLRLPDGSRNELAAAASPGTASPRVPGGSRTEVRFAPANPRMCGTGETLADSLGRTCEGVAPTAREGAVSTAREGAAGVAGNVLDMPAHLWDEARGVFAGDAVYLGQISYEHRLSNKELVLTGLSNNTAFILVVLGVLAALVQVVGELAPLLFGDLAPVMNYAFSWGMDTFGGGLVAALAVGVVGVMVLVWTLSAVGSCISYGGFRCCRRGSRIEVERGLLQHRFQGVNVDRVQSVIVKQSFVRRLLGYCEVSLGKIDAAQEGTNGQQGASLQQGLIIHPFVKLDRVPEILAGVIPEFSDVPVDVRPVAPVALRRAIVRRAVLQGGGFWLAVCTALVHIPLNLALASVPSAAASPEALFASSVLGVTATILYVLAVVLFALDVVGAVLWHRDSGFAFNRAFMQVSNGGFSRETVSFPRKKIQFGYTRVNPFQRRARTATLNARTAAGVGGTTVRLIDVREEDAAAWLSWLKPHGNVVE